VVAGPFLEKNKENYRGMFIFNTKSKEEAEQWVKTDPAVQAGVFSYEVFPGMAQQLCLFILNTMMKLQRRSLKQD
jgi:hypothetical protein